MRKRPISLMLGGLLLTFLLCSGFRCNPPPATPVALAWKYNCAQFGNPSYFEYGTTPDKTTLNVLGTLVAGTCTTNQQFSTTTPYQSTYTTSTIFYVRAYLPSGYSSIAFATALQPSNP